MSENKANFENIQTKIKVLTDSLKRQGSWYTGLSIKRYLRKEIFKLQTPAFVNTAINSGRWSVYCHYFQEKAFINLLDKNEIKFGSSVVIHPLLPENLVDILVKRQVEMIFLDISKTSHNINKQDLVSILDNRRENRPVDLVIHYGFNGLYEEITELIKTTQNYIIPSIVVIDNFDLNLALLNLFEAVTMGGVLWNFGDSFFDDQLNLASQTPLPTQNWFVSWQIENRTKSVLEYHLSDSHKIVLPFIKAYLFLLIEKSKLYNWTGHIKSFLSSNFWFKNDFKTTEEAQNILLSGYNRLYEVAIPDLVFDLQTISPERNKDFGKAHELIEKSSRLQTRSKDLNDHFLQNLASRAQGSLEIPDYFLDKTYLKYFVYTTETDFWVDNMKYFGFYAEKLPGVHQIIKNSPNLVNANFVAEYGLFVDVWSGVMTEV